MLGVFLFYACRCHLGIFINNSLDNGLQQQPRQRSQQWPRQRSQQWPQQ